MCGILGKYVVSGDDHVSEELLWSMADTLAHRGPDDRGVYADGPVGLGHRRLSIIDIEGGHQPMHSQDGTKVIVYNGEVYNFRALRKTLQKKGHRFVTSSDTEVILRSYEQYGPRCVHHLRGMFAFAIWDSRQRVLFLARDRVGIKPLYYYWDGRRFIFSSEIKAILRDSEADRSLDWTALDAYLTYLYIPAPKSIFRRIRKLRPGHTLTVSDQGLRESEYWDVVFDPAGFASEEACARGLIETIRDSVTAHLESDVPVGAFLSGGLDSSAVVSVMSRLLDRPVITASIGFLEKRFDELSYARKVARLHGADAWEKVVEPSAVSTLDTLVWHFDEPFADASMIPTYYVSRVARERVKVCLSGDGGDENFAGYRRYRFDVLENRIRRLVPSGVRRPVFGFLGNFYPKADWLPRGLRAKTLLSNLAIGPEQAYCRTMSWFTREMKDKLYQGFLRRELKDYDPFQVLYEHFARTDQLDPLARLLYVDFKTYLVDDILTKVDRASMAHSLEVRVPLLDHRVVEYAASIPSRYKLRGQSGKYIFKKAMAGYLPDDVLHRRKMGFAVPLAEWLRGELREMFIERVLSKRSLLGQIFDQRQIDEWWSQHQRKTRDYSYHLWALLVLESWGQRFLDGVWQGARLD